MYVGGVKRVTGIFQEQPIGAAEYGQQVSYLIRSITVVRTPERPLLESQAIRPEKPCQTLFDTHRSLAEFPECAPTHSAFVRKSWTFTANTKLSLTTKFTTEHATIVSILASR